MKLTPEFKVVEKETEKWDISWSFQDIALFKPDVGLRLEEFGKTEEVEHAIAKSGTVYQELQQKIPDILHDVESRLKQYFSSWKPRNVKIYFGSYKWADFRHPDRGVIEVDVLRLLRDEKWYDVVVKGISHELVHEWMGEGDIDFGSMESVLKMVGTESFSGDVKVYIKNKIIDEGLAVFISGQSLKRRYENLGENYESVVKNSFEYLNECMTRNYSDAEDAKTVFQKGYKNMGPWYVVGFEMIRKILDGKNSLDIQNLLLQFRLSPESAFELYSEKEIGKV